MRRRRARHLVLAAVFVCFAMMSLSGLCRASDDLTLWYDEPAEEWLEAQPLGNGRLGAMVFGGVQKGKIQLNEESLWSGQPLDCNPEGALENLPKIRKLLFKGKNKEAYELAQKYLLGDPRSVRSHQCLGYLHMDFDAAGNYTDYRRELNLRTGISRVSYRQDGTRYTREAFTSAPDDILVVRLTAGDGGSIDLTLKLTRRQDASVQTTGDNELLLTGQVVDEPDPSVGPGGKHMRFAARLRASQNGGSLTASDKSLTIQDADRVILRLTAATDYRLQGMDFDRDREPARICADILDDAAGTPYAELRKRHVRDHRPMMKRVALELGDSPHPDLPTDERLQKVKEGAHDPQLVEQLFQFGRYLLMGTSRRPGRLPGNLQGLWNKHMKAPWG
ncbi:MAG: glycoside hydrolase family 95 protein, partial [Planctomycetota bacterium]